ncbi:MAG: SURF1 family protein [Methylotenera sp.]|uniref:SURF1 family protein n=1 Tax=Methylotenera sp. TaxID=2051956 RepID=UPI002716DA3B|nr:SURF1 family protein [Methylotenera sp.]MDO9151406.1 SURF1 family protein [Methylotenera sp.]
MQFRLGNYLFCPSWLGFIILMICIPLFIKLGLWQYNKAELRKEIQSSYNASLDHDALTLPNNINHLDAWKYKKVKIKGHYETKYQILLDNQVEENVAGFHVITPLKLDGSNDYVLINRGWVAGGANHTDIPAISTPNEPLEIIGLVWVPSKKIFTLESDAEKNHWNTVWQHMDMDRYQKNVPIHILPLVIKLDVKSDAGGFVRNWQLPASKIATNIGYAYQWFGFTIASILIFLFTSIKKANNTKT